MNPPPWRKPYQRKGSSFWWARLPVADGSNRERSLGVRDRKQAHQALRLLESSFSGPFRERSIVFAVARGDLTVSEFMEAQERRQLDDLAERIRNPDPDLNDRIESWQEWLRTRRGTAESTRLKYLQQVRALIPAGQKFPKSSFTRATVAQFLNGLNIGAPNRYRAALSSLARYLVELDVLEHNPVRDVSAAKERQPRINYLSAEEAQRLVAAIAGPEARAAHALMCGSGMEVGAVLALKHRDVDLEDGTVNAHGTKRVDRDRVVRITHPWCAKIVSDWLRTRRSLPDAPVFHITYWALRDALKRACKAVDIADYRTHDWRHTYAVQSLKDEERPEVVAHQLGHKTAAMVHKVYGRYVPNASDYRANQSFRQTVGDGTTAKGRTMRRIG